MSNIVQLYQKYAEKSSNAFHEMMSDPSLKGVQYSQEEHLPNLRLLFNKYNRDGILLASSCAQECNGLVLNLEHGKIVTFTDPVSGEDGDPASWEKMWEMARMSDHPANGDPVVTKMEPGTVIRIAYMHDTKSWLVSTNRKLDARSAFYGSGRSFYEKIENCIKRCLPNYSSSTLDEIFDQTLNSAFMYMFIFNDEHGTLPVPKSELVFVSLRDQTTLQPVTETTTYEPLWARSVIRLTDDAQIDYQLKQGRGVVLHQKNGTKMKFDSFFYRNNFYLFQDRPILETFLNVLQQEKFERVDTLKKMYHHLHFEMNLLQLWFFRYAFYIHYWYKQIKIYHRGRLAPMSTTLSLIQELHQCYNQHREAITIEKVKNVLIRNIGNDPELYLGHLLHLKSEKRL